MARRILVTSALPYANASLHLGHIMEAVQTDIWVRFQKMRGHDCIYCSAEDAHGTPIMIRAQQEGIRPETLIARTAEEHRRDYAGFLIGFDQFHTTHSAENVRFTHEIYAKLRDRGYIARRTVRQAYDEQAGMFLPDRYVRGTCPRCKSPDQYGDSCEVCGSTYTPAELIDPISTVTADHARLARVRSPVFQTRRIRAHAARVRRRQQPAARGAREAGRMVRGRPAGLGHLARRAVFRHRNTGRAGKYFYVWFDAPIGYIGSFEAWRAAHAASFDDYWKSEVATELYHFIGKDISYFHTLFWPAVLRGAGLRRPTGVFVHGFLTINGQKMSKSRGTFITAQRFLERLPPEPLRYYFAAKLGSGIEDIDFSLDDFVARTNADLVGKLVNIASRCAGFIERGGGRLAAALPEPALYDEFTVSRRAHCITVRVARLLGRNPRDHGAGRPRQPLRRSAQALGARQRSRARRRSTRNRHPGIESVSGADELPGTRAAAHGAGRGGVSRDQLRRLERHRGAAARAAALPAISRWRRGWTLKRWPH